MIKIMKDENREWEAYVMGLVAANHSRAVTAARQAAAQGPEPDRPQLSKRVLNVLGGVLWTAVMALAVAACIIYAAR